MPNESQMLVIELQIEWLCLVIILYRICIIGIKYDFIYTPSTSSHSFSISISQNFLIHWITHVDSSIEWNVVKPNSIPCWIFEKSQKLSDLLGFQVQPKRKQLNVVFFLWFLRRQRWNSRWRETSIILISQE